jgi:hypothetical protein
VLQEILGRLVRTAVLELLDRQELPLIRVQRVIREVLVQLALQGQQELVKRDLLVIGE